MNDENRNVDQIQRVDWMKAVKWKNTTNRAQHDEIRGAQKKRRFDTAAATSSFWSTQGAVH